MDLPGTKWWWENLLQAQVAVLHDGAVTLGYGSTEQFSFACTLDFADIDTGLVMEAQRDIAVRSELLTLATAGTPPRRAVRVLGEAVDELVEAHGMLAAQPGTVLTCGELVVPQLWEGKVPQLNEPGRFTGILEFRPAG